jgi:hypothetical protein
MADSPLNTESFNLRQATSPLLIRTLDDVTPLTLEPSTSAAVALARTILQNNRHILSAISWHEGAVYINNEMTVGPPDRGQNIRKILVDQTTCFCIYDEVLRNLCTQFQDLVKFLVKFQSRLFQLN